MANRSPAKRGRAKGRRRLEWEDKRENRQIQGKTRRGLAKRKLHRVRAKWG
jgi:hypothetical protein